MDPDAARCRLPGARLQRCPSVPRAPDYAAGKYQLDGQASFELTPGWRGEQTIQGRTTAISINSRGMRSDEIGAKIEGELRILMFGDSYVFGHGVDEHETIPARLQARLRVALGDDKLRVGNCGVSGQGLRDMARNVARQRHLDPDLIIACTYLGNDFTDDCRRHTAIVEGHHLVGPMGRLAHTSTRFRLALRYRSVYLVEKLLLEHAPSLSFRPELAATAEEIAALEHFPPATQHTGNLFFDRRQHDALVEKILSTSRTSYAAIAATAAGVPVLHVIIPGRWHAHRGLWQQTLTHLDLDPAAHEFGGARRRISALLKSMGQQIHDLTDAILAQPQPATLWFKLDKHFSPRGCNQVAEDLLPVVRQILDR